MRSSRDDRQLQRIELERRARMLVKELGSYSAAARKLGMSRQAVHYLVGPSLADGRQMAATCIDCGCSIVTNSGVDDPRCSRCSAYLQRTGRRWSAEHVKRPRRSHCKHGHPLDKDNIYITPDGRRQCRKCINIRLAHHKIKRQEQET